MMCSDGFRHKITPQEMIERLGPGTCVDEAKMKEGCELSLIHIVILISLIGGLMYFDRKEIL